MPNLSMNLKTTAIDKLLSRSEIFHQTTVIAYGSYPGIGALIFCFLKLFGHDKVFVLNGGHQKWVAEGRPITSELSNFTHTQYQAKSPNASLQVLQAEVQASMAQSD
jgi:thiosulfate/3-mercaptopyruvate sulfurtransferase